MTPSLRVPALAFTLAFSLLCSGSALADLPGPREECDASEQCQACWQSYGSDAERQEGFKTCSDPLTAKGFVEACRHRQGAGDEVYFCPPGVEVKKTIRGGGCGACSVGTGELSTGIAASALGLLALLFRRRNRNK